MMAKLKEPMKSTINASRDAAGVRALFFTGNSAWRLRDHTRGRSSSLVGKMLADPTMAVSDGPSLRDVHGMDLNAPPPSLRQWFTTAKAKTKMTKEPVRRTRSGTGFFMHSTRVWPQLEEGKLAAPSEY